MHKQNKPSPNPGNASGNDLHAGGMVGNLKKKNTTGNKEALVDDNDENYDSDAGYLSPQAGEGLTDKDEITGMGNSKFKPKKGQVSP